VATVTDYYAFGSAVKDRTASFTITYKFSMNTQEKEPELGEGVTSAEFWVYDGKLGRRWNVDRRGMLSQSSYCAFNNSPILFIDIHGDTSWIYSTSGKLLQQINSGGKRMVIFMDENSENYKNFCNAKEDLNNRVLLALKARDDNASDWTEESNSNLQQIIKNREDIHEAWAMLFSAYIYDLESISTWAKPIMFKVESTKLKDNKIVSITNENGESIRWYVETSGLMVLGGGKFVTNSSNFSHTENTDHNSQIIKSMPHEGDRVADLHIHPNEYYIRELAPMYKFVVEFVVNGSRQVSTTYDRPPLGRSSLEDDLRAQGFLLPSVIVFRDGILLHKSNSNDIFIKN
jgi:hypothetical protein